MYKYELRQIIFMCAVETSDYFDTLFTKQIPLPAYIHSVCTKLKNN